MPDTLPSTVVSVPQPPQPRQPMGIIPRTLEEVWRVATASCKGGLAPRFANDPARVAAIMMAGLELHLPPMASLRLFYCTPDGQPALMVRGMLAVVQGRGVLEFWHDYMEGEGEDRAAVVTLQRRGYPRLKRRFSVADARNAELIGKRGNMYGKWLDRMLLSRAMSFALNDQFSDLLGGLYDPSELGGPVFDEDGTELYPPCAPEPIVPPPPAKIAQTQTPDEFWAEFWARGSLLLHTRSDTTVCQLMSGLVRAIRRAPNLELLDRLFKDQPAALLAGAMKTEEWQVVEAAHRNRIAELNEESNNGDVAAQ